jgi:hypothetical protein
MWSILLLERAGLRRIETLKESWERKDVSLSASQQCVLSDREICYQAASVTPATVRRLCVCENAINGSLQTNEPTFRGEQTLPTSLSSKLKATSTTDLPTTINADSNLPDTSQA